MANNTPLKTNNSTIKKGHKIAIALVFVLFVSLIVFQWNNISKKIGIGAKEETLEFDKTDKRLKIIVASFDSNCDDGVSVAKKYFNYLENQNTTDSLNANILYLEMVKDAQISVDSAQRELKRNNADLFIYWGKVAKSEPVQYSIQYLLSDSLKYRNESLNYFFRSKNQLVDKDSMCGLNFQSNAIAMMYFYSAVNDFDDGKYANALKKLKVAEANSTDTIRFVYQYMGATYGKLNDVANAEKYLKRNIELASNHNDTLFLIDALDEITVMYITNNMFAPAIEFGAKSQGMKETRIPVDSAALATSYNNNAIAHFYNNDLEQAKTLINKAVRIRKRLFNDSHPDVQDALKNRRVIYQDELKKQMSNE